VSSGDPGIYAMAAAVFEVLGVKTNHHGTTSISGCARDIGHASGSASRCLRTRFLCDFTVGYFEALDHH
jgi:hypothetical protein